VKTFILSSLLLAVLIYQPDFEKDRRLRPGRRIFKEQTETRSVDGFQARMFKSRRGETMPYRLFIPANYDAKRKYPIVFWLHGGGGRGNDNLKQISGGNVDGTRVWVSAAAQQKNPVFVLAPQCPIDQSWTTIEGVRSTRALEVALEVLSSVEQEFNIDLHRRYVAGQSMGGLGTWSVITEHPRMFAAAIPVCGAGDESLASRLIRMPIWAFHGALDQTVSVNRSRRMIDAIRQAGGDPRYTEYPNVGHNSWEPAFREPRLLDWVFAQKGNGK
jgi:predicted peptidase